MIEPDFIYDPDDWEVTMEWSERAEMADCSMVGKLGDFKRFATLVKGPDKFAAYVLKQDAQDTSDIELRWFDSEDEAERACALRPATLVSED